MDSNKHVKYDWYQTETHVTINVLIKNLKPENVRVDLVDQKLTCSARLPDETDCELALNLAHSVHPNQYTLKVLPSKIEIKLKKGDGIQWKVLHLEDAEKNATKDADAIAKTYPSSKPQKKDWDKLASEIKKEEAAEKLDGEAALNQMFQKIYSEGSDETRKAMNKSFLESGGTVLSTNWKEVGEKKIDVKPPDGMEWKQWKS